MARREAAWVLDSEQEPCRAADASLAGVPVHWEGPARRAVRGSAVESPELSPWGCGRGQWPAHRLRQTGDS